MLSDGNYTSSANSLLVYVICGIVCIALAAFAVISCRTAYNRFQEGKDASTVVYAGLFGLALTLLLGAMYATYILYQIFTGRIQ
jgi:hypothetical protein